MLLLVLQAQLDQPFDFPGLASRLRCADHDQRFDACVDVVAIVPYLIHSRPRDKAAPGSWILFSDAVVIRIAQHAKGRMEWTKARFVGFEYKRFKKPGRMCKRPFDRTCIGHAW